MFRKILSLIIVTFFLLNSNATAFGSTYIKLEEGQYVYVEDVIDANSFVVSVNGNEALVKILGTNINGYTDSKDFMESLLLSKEVYYKSSNIDKGDRWNYGDFVYNDNSIASYMLKNGLATVDEYGLSSSVILSYQELEDSAKKNNYNYWERYDKETTVISYDAININTATKAQIIDVLGVTDVVASNIIEYRKYNPFNNSEEIKFVEGVTSKIFNKIEGKFVVATNINTANSMALESISGISSAEATKIITNRSSSSYTETTFKDSGFLTSTEYSNAIPFIYYSGSVTSLEYSVPNVVININTATVSQMTKAGLSSSDASSIYRYTDDNKYVYHNFMELSKISGVSSIFDEYNIYKYEDNINFVTNINNASKSEIASLYGDYADSYSTQIDTLYDKNNYTSFSQISEYFPSSLLSYLKKVIVFDDEETDYVNINTCSVSDLTEIGLSSSVAQSVLEDRNIYQYNRLYTDIEDYSDKISLYTNVNTASHNEIERLSSELSYSVISNFIDYRDDEYFGSLDEVREYFEDLDLEDVYEDFEDFITAR
ncbi:MAG: helix-hairpin-helix domain-containing protein [Lachnospirales bacterium]